MQTHKDVIIDSFSFLINFFILDIEEDDEVPLFFRRLLLAFKKGLVDNEQGKLMLRFQEEKVTFNVFEAMCHPNDEGNCFRIDIIEDSVE